MIPTIETIIEGLLSGEYTKQQAVGWLHQHAEDAGRCLRDEFAMAALQGIIALSDGVGTRQETAKYCYGYADSMIEQRNK